MADEDAREIRRTLEDIKTIFHTKRPPNNFHPRAPYHWVACDVVADRYRRKGRENDADLIRTGWIVGYESHRMMLELSVAAVLYEETYQYLTGNPPKAKGLYDHREAVENSRSDTVA